MNNDKLLNSKNADIDLQRQDGYQVIELLKENADPSHQTDKVVGQHQQLLVKKVIVK